MKNLLEADFIFFGFGKLTENIINSLASNDQQIICVSNMQKTYISTSRLKFVLREEIVRKRIRVRNAIFVWKDPTPLNDELLMHWLKSDLFSLSRSFLLSSSSIYKDSLKILSEDQNNLEPNLKNNDKFNLENRLTELFASKGNHHSNLRISNVYGKGLSHGLISSLINSIRNDKPVTIFKQGDILRDYLSVKDLVSAIEKLANLTYSENTINVSTGVGVTIHEILEIFKAQGHSFDSRIVISAPFQLKKSVVLDCSLLESKVLWKPVSVKIGINELLKEF
jgi:nucleoside-diphosphate-sugar epimerase